MPTVSLSGKKVILVLGGSVSGTNITNADIDLNDGSTVQLAKPFSLGPLVREEAWIEPWGGGSNYAAPVLANYADRKTVVTAPLYITGANWGAVRSTYQTIRDSLDKASPGPLFYSTNGQSNMDQIPIYRSPVDPIMFEADVTAAATQNKVITVTLRIWRAPYAQGDTRTVIG